MWTKWPRFNPGPRPCTNIANATFLKTTLWHDACLRADRASSSRPMDFNSSRALYQYRTSRTDLYPPLVGCKPATGPSFFDPPGFEIVEAPELKSIFILNIAGPHSWRVIYMDGRPHPTGDDLRPTFFGHSIGHWEGDTLVIDSVGFNEKQWVAGSYPTTEKLHLIERISRPNLKTLSYEFTIDDPGAYTKPWSGFWTITEKTPSSWISGGEMFEYICRDSRQ